LLNIKPLLIHKMKRTALALFFFLSTFCNFAQYTGCDSLVCYTTHQFPAISFTIHNEFESTEWTAVYQSPLVIDVTNDCIPEIIISGTDNYTSSPRLTSGLQILSSTTGETIQTIPTARYSWISGNSYAAADVDNDGIPEFIVAVADHSSNPMDIRGRLVCYKLNGNIHWISDQQFGSNVVNSLGGTVGMADFNMDGIPEVYIYNEIFNAQTGIKLADGGENGTGVLDDFYGGQFSSISIIIAGQLDTDTTDLELAAGYTIYKVSITNPNGTAGNIMTPMNIMVDGIYRDGLTSLADINQDGQLDVIVSTYGSNATARLYAYTIDGGTPQLLSQTTLPQTGTFWGSGPPAIGEIDGSGQPRILISRSSRLLAYSYNNTSTFQLKWSMYTTDDSGMTGLTLFDFNQNGRLEIVYRDMTNLLIIDGSGATPQILDSIACSSVTGLEKPIVADIDNSGTSKICITCGSQLGKLKVFSAWNKQHRWAPSRGIWNQYAYHVFNIADDLTIPQFQVNNATQSGGRYNNFYVQSSLLDEDGNFLQKAADVSIQINCVNYNPQSDEYFVSFSLTNGDISAFTLQEEMPVAFFNNDPVSGGSLIGVYYTDIRIPAGATIENLVFTIPFSTLSNVGEVFAVANSSSSFIGVPYQPIHFYVNECDYSNNISSSPVLHPQFLFDTIPCRETYFFHDQELTAKGRYHAVFDDVSGCDSVIVLELYVLPFYEPTDVFDTICSGQMYSFDGKIFNVPGRFSTTLSDIDGCDSVVILNLAVMSKPVAGFTFSPDSVVRIETPVFFQDVSTGSINWLWNFGTNLPDGISTEQNPVFTFTRKGEYFVRQFVEDKWGCVDSISQKILVTAPFNVLIPNAFSPNGDGLNDTFGPFAEGVRSDGFEMMIFDRWGRNVFTTYQINERWDGMINGRRARSNSIFSYIIRVLNEAGEVHQFIGSLIVVY
jgi:gliding motility-associated-like protein